MPRDARLGLVVGVGLVIGFAVLSFGKDPYPRPAGNVQTPASAPGGYIPSALPRHAVSAGESSPHRPGR